MVDSEPKILPCIFFDDVLCSYRKTSEFGLMDRCMKCSYYFRFFRESEEEEEEFWEEVDRIRRNGFDG